MVGVDVWKVVQRCGGRDEGRVDDEDDGPCVRLRVRATRDPVPLAYGGGGVTRVVEGS